MVDENDAAERGVSRTSEAQAAADEQLGGRGNSALPPSSAVRTPTVPFSRTLTNRELHRSHSHAFRAGNANNMSNALTEAQRASHDEPEKVTSKLRANAGQIIAGIITSFEMLVDCAALASVLTLQSSALGSIQRISVVTKGAVVMSGIFSLFVNQLFMNMFSKCEPYVVSLGWEAVPLFITLMRSVRKDVDAKNEGRELEDHLGPTITAYTAVVLSGLLAGVLMMGLAKARLVSLFSFVPEVMLCGMYACIGWQLFTLGFDLSTDGGAALYLDQPEQLHRLFEAAQWPLWLTGLLLGLALYAAMEYVPERYSSYTIPLYYLSCIVIFNAAFAAAGTSLAEAAELKWTVAACASPRTTSNPCGASSLAGKKPATHATFGTHRGAQTRRTTRGSNSGRATSIRPSPPGKTTRA